MQGDIGQAEFFASFCQAGYCQMAENGKLLYRDGHNLNINGSKKVGPVNAGHVNEHR